jgi:ABC-2 type transport system permease protein
MIFLVEMRKEWLEKWRTYHILVSVVVLLLFGFTSPLLAKSTPELIKLIPEGEAIAQLIPEPTIGDAVSQYVKNISQFGVILALVLTMGAVVREKEKGTAGIMLVKPLPRPVFLLAKFATQALLFVVALTLAGAACFYYTWLLFGSLAPVQWILLNTLLLVFFLVYVALTLLGSVLMRTQAAAGGVGLGLLILLQLLGSIPGIGDYFPSQLLAWGSELALGSSEPAWPALAVSIGIIVLALVVSIVVLERQEL